MFEYINGSEYIGYRWKNIIIYTDIDKIEKFANFIRNFCFFLVLMQVYFERNVIVFFFFLIYGVLFFYVNFSSNLFVLQAKKM